MEVREFASGINYEVVVTPDTSHAAVLERGTIRVRQVQDYGLQAIWETGLRRLRGAVWSPDSQRLAVAGESPDSSGINGERELQVWALDRSPCWRVQGLASDFLLVAWSPDGSRIMTVGGNTTVTVRDARTGATLLTLGDKDSNSYVLANCWSPDSRQVVLVHEDGLLRIWDARTGQKVLARDCHDEVVECVRWSPDGTRLAVASQTGNVLLWDALAGHFLAARAYDSGIWALDWSPDGTRLLLGCSTGHVLVLDAATGQELLRLRSYGALHRVAWSPDGRRILVTEDPASLRIWTVGTGLFHPLAPALARSGDTYALLDLYEEQGMESSILEVRRC